MSVHSGFIFCFTNKSMPGLVNLGFTLSSVQESLKSANSTDNMWLPPTPYEVQFAKKVSDAEAKYQNLVLILREYHSQKGSFFQISPSALAPFFHLMDGVDWSPENDPADTRIMTVSPLHDLQDEETPLAEEEPLDFDDETAVEQTSTSAETIDPPPLTPSRRRTQEEKKRRCQYKFTRGRQKDHACGRVCAVGDEKYCLGHACFANVAKAEGYSHARQIVHMSPHLANNRCKYKFLSGASAGLKCMKKGKEEFGGMCNTHRAKGVVQTN